MTKIICEDDCGNAPKRLQLRDLNIAFAKGDIAGVLEYLSDNVVWDFVGQERIEGKANVEAFLQKAAEREKEELHLINIMTHGNIGGANGTVTLKGNAPYHFSHIYAFTSGAKTAKIKAITSYVIGTSLLKL
jgi:ketosteroid isomerase-like protein